MGHTRDRERYYHNMVTSSIRHMEMLSPEVCALEHYNDVILNPMASQITSLTIVYSIIYSGANQRKPHTKGQ